MNPIKYKGETVITTSLLAQVYETTPKQISNNFSRNKDKFQEGKHYFKLTGEELQEFKDHSSLRGMVMKGFSWLYLWTERGANRHCKILDTDKAWEQFDNLEEAYFRTRHTELPGSVSNIKYLNGVANYLRVQRKIMLDKGCSPYEIAQMDKLTCDTYGIPVPESLTSPIPYQMSLLESGYDLTVPSLN